jgi:serine/threonine-protein kinase RIO1
MAWYIFEFFSILDHSQRIVYEVTNEFFDTIRMDVKNVVRTFSYADENQTLAQMREQHKLALALVMSMTLLMSAVTLAFQVMPTMSKAAEAGKEVIGSHFAQNAAVLASVGNMLAPFVEQAGKVGETLSPVVGLVNNAYIGLQNAAVTLSPEKDT